METPIIPTSRIEAFSDGVIAIIITIMVFDLKVQNVPTEQNLAHEFAVLLPKLLSYIVSFIMLAVMWVSHHQLFHQIRQSESKLLWYNLHLLFWMSFIPFCTNFIGASPWMWQSSTLYGSIFFMNAFAFTILRDYVVKEGLIHETISREAQEKVRRKNRLTLAIYATSAVAGILSVYISFVLFIVVPAMYFIPEKIVHEANEEGILP